MPGPIKITGSTRFRKRNRKAQMPLLPGDMSLLREMERERKSKRDHAESRPLEYIGPLRNFSPLGDKRDRDPSDASVMISSVLGRMWEEFPTNDKGHHSINHNVVAEVAEYRQKLPKAVTMSQLYGVFPHATTKVDRVVNQASQAGTVRIISLNLADSSDLIMEADEFYRTITPLSSHLTTLCNERPDSTWFDIGDLRAHDVDIQQAVKNGILTADPGKPGVYFLSIPNQGLLLKLVRQTRVWLLKTMVQANRKFKELPEYQLQERLEHHTKYWTQLKGISLEWALYDAIGGGWIDGFLTPVGRGWKVLRS